MSRIKIFVDAHVFDDSFQGTTTYIKGLYSALVKDSDFEITLAAHNIEKLKTVFTDPRFKFIAFIETSKYKRLALEIPALIKKNGFDFAHFQYITPPIKSCRYINTIHDLLFLDFPQYFPWTYRFTKKHIFKFSANRSEIICTVSEYSKKALIKHYQIPAEKILITANAVSEYTGPFSDVKSKYKLNKYILFVSRMEPRKNHYLMLKSFVELALYEQGYKLVFIGRTKDVKTENYHNYYNSLDEIIKDSVLHIENISYEELNSFYKNADLFVYPSLAEGFGIPPLEAAIMECKVLCSNQTAMSDFDFFGKYLFDPSDPQQLKEKILNTLDDQNYPFEKIKNAVIQKYNWKNIADAFGERLKHGINKK